MPVARSTDVHLSELDLAAIADFMQSPDPLSTCGDEEMPFMHHSFIDL